MPRPAADTGVTDRSDSTAGSFTRRCAAELEALPMPYRFDVKALAAIRHQSLIEHIERVGIRIYEACPPR